MQNISEDEVRRIARFAEAAGKARDVVLDKIRDVALRDAKPARGEHDPAGAYGLNFLPVDHPDRVALREAIAGLTPEARQELRALVWVGQGEYAVKEWADAVADAAAGSEDIPADSFLDYPNLHECLTKGLYELRRH